MGGSHQAPAEGREILGARRPVDQGRQDPAPVNAAAQGREYPRHRAAASTERVGMPPGSARPGGRLRLAIRPSMALFPRVGRPAVLPASTGFGSAAADGCRLTADVGAAAARFHATPYPGHLRFHALAVFGAALAHRRADTAHLGMERHHAHHEISGDETGLRTVAEVRAGQRHGCPQAVVPAAGSGRVEAGAMAIQADPDAAARLGGSGLAAVGDEHGSSFRRAVDLRPGSAAHGAAPPRRHGRGCRGGVSHKGPLSLSAPRG